MHSQRVKSALIFVPLVLIMIYLGGWAFNLFISIVLLVAAVEYAQLFGKLGAPPPLLSLLPGICLALGFRWFFDGQHLDLLLLIALLLTAMTALIQYERGVKNAALGFAVTFTGILYLGWIGSFFIAIRALPNGLGWILTALPTTWLVDSGAYYLGSWIGKSKMVPRLSPNKTWAGFAGGMAAGVISGVLLIMLWRLVGFLPTATPLWQGAVMGLVMGILSPIGDLLISLFKRSSGVKDTGNLIPGHGGFLDRIDTWIWAAMLGYFLVTVLGW